MQPIHTHLGCLQTFLQIKPDSIPRRSLSNHKAVVFDAAQSGKSFRSLSPGCPRHKAGSHTATYRLCRNPLRVRKPGILARPRSSFQDMPGERRVRCPHLDRLGRKDGHLGSVQPPRLQMRTIRLITGAKAGNTVTDFENPPYIFVAGYERIVDFAALDQR